MKRATIPLIERLFRKIQILPAAEGGHWLYTGALNTNGYGVIRDGADLVLVHRVTLALATNDDGIGMDAAHDDARDCPRHCCCPSHLSWKCHWSNLKDVIDKHGRLGIGLKSARRPLSLPEVNA